MDLEMVLYRGISSDFLTIDEQKFAKHGFTKTTKNICSSAPS